METYTVSYQFRMQLKGVNNYDPDSINQLSEKYMTIDPAFSSSKFAILVGEWFKSENK